MSEKIMENKTAVVLGEALSTYVMQEHSVRALLDSGKITMEDYLQAIHIANQNARYEQIRAANASGNSTGAGIQLDFVQG